MLSTSEHYILIIDIDETNVYAFDPYYLGEDFINKDKDFEIVFNQQFSYNRIIKLSRLMDESNKDFALMKKDKREVVLINKNTP